MKLRTKILGGYGLILLLLILVWGMAVLSLYRLGRAGEAILTENQASVLAAENMIDHIERQDSAALLVLLGYEDTGLAQFRDNQVEFSQWLGRARDNVTLEGEAPVIAAIDSGYRDFLDAFAELENIFAKSGAVAETFYHQRLLPRFHQVRADCFNLREMNQHAMEEASKRAHRLSVRTIWSMTAVGGVFGLLGLLLSILLSGILVRPLSAMTRVTEHLAEGNYDIHLEVRSNDELGLLGEQIITMSQKLKAFHELNVGRLIAEKRRGEAILRSIGDGLVVVDAGLRVIAVNPAAARILGISATDSEGCRVAELLPNERLLDIIHLTAESGTAPKLSPEQAELTLGEEENPRWFRFSVTPVRSEGGRQVLGIVILLQDVTSFKELERLKSEFVLAASHELKTPLTGLTMSISLLQETAESLSARQQDLLRVAREDANRLRSLVEDLLDLSRLESGRVEMEIVPLPVDSLLQQTLGAFYSQAESKGIQLIPCLPAAPLKVMADPTKTAWVLSNLISNALRYTSRGGHIHVTADDRGEWVYLAVADDGDGIPAEYRSRIFDKFVQVKGDAKAGSGLGLAICKEIVKAHGGSIWVDSAVGQGSTFTFTLKTAPATRENAHSEENQHV
jgi:NtrC-family two-component system sensor histidine kinase KinB